MAVAVLYVVFLLRLFRLLRLLGTLRSLVTQTTLMRLDIAQKARNYHLTTSELLFTSCRLRLGNAKFK